MKAAAYIKPVLLELGGKNFSIVLADADLEKAATKVLIGAFLNVCFTHGQKSVQQSTEIADPCCRLGRYACPRIWF